MKSIFSTFFLIAGVITFTFSQKVQIKDTDNNILMEVNDEGRTGSIFLEPGVVPGIFSDKIYNVNGDLFWSGSMLGTENQAGGWTLNGLNLYPTDLSTRVGIGTMTPLYPFQVVGTSTNDVTMALRNLNNTGYSRMLFGADPASDGSIILFGPSSLSNADKFRFSNNRTGGLFEWYINSQLRMALHNSGLLDIAGKLKVGDDASTPSAGVIKYTSASGFEGYDGSGWLSLGGDGKWLSNGRKIYYNLDYVGIGNTDPGFPLQVTRTNSSDDNTPVATFHSEGFNSAGSIRLENSLGNYWVIGTLQDPDHSLSFNYRSNNILTGSTFKISPQGNVGIGTASPSYPLHVAATNIERAGNFDLTSNTGFSYAVYGVSGGTGGEAYIGTYGKAQGTGVTQNIGISGIAMNGSTNYGGYFNALSTETNYAVYGSATGGTLNYAGYFEDGDVIVENGELGVGILDPLAKVHIVEVSENDVFRVDDELSDASPFIIKDDGDVGIGTNTPSAQLHVAGENGVLFGGTFGLGTIPASGAGTRMMWYPGKAAFRAGSTVDQWDDIHIGDYSTAMGGFTMASGNHSTAMGSSTGASGIASTAIGHRSLAFGDYSTALGNSSWAEGEGSLAAGYSALASGHASIALGQYCEAQGAISFANGYFTEAIGFGSTAMGGSSNAYGKYSTAMGHATGAAAYIGMAIGRYNVGGGDSSVWVEDDPLFEIGNGTSYSNTRNAMTVYKNGHTEITGLSDNLVAEFAYHDSISVLGVMVPVNYGVIGVATDIDAVNYGVYGRAGSSVNDHAGYFDGKTTVRGDLNVDGTLNKGSGTFKIDHPLDPENKYLYHSFIESPDMMNVYNGNVTTDEEGYAIVELPTYFEALNKDFRYQLTVIGDFAQAIISEEITDNHFVIRTDKPNIKVSWQVTGIRNDAYARKNRIQVEVDKSPSDRGYYLHPEAFGKDKTLKEGYAENNK